MKYVKSVLFLFLCINLLSCRFFAVGSYPYTEYYKLDLTRDSLIVKLNHLKEIHSNLKVYTIDENDMQKELSEGSIGSTFWSANYHLNDGTIILCVINMSDQIENRPSYLGLVGLSKDNRSTWKDINTKDLSHQENKKVKKMFEEEILDNLGEWEHK